MEKTILIADDDPDLLEVFSCGLTQAGFSTITVTNGIDAIRMARSRLPDLVVLDVTMPQLDGFTVCETLRNQSATARIPILLLTGLVSELGRVAGLGGGADDYVMKPITSEQLISRIEVLLRDSSSGTKAQNKPPSKGETRAPDISVRKHDAE